MKTDKEYKKEIQDLRTELNLYKKSINQIQFEINNIKREPYDYGVAYENAIFNIKENIANLNYFNLK